MTKPDFTVEIDVRATLRDLDKLARKQAPFAVALALTMTAKDAQAEVKRTLPEKFTIRTPWVAKGIRIEPARKSDWPRVRSAVLSKNKFMALQEFGGTKTGKSGGSVAVPAGARKTPRQTTPRSRWPGALLKRGAFILKTARGPAIARRRGAGVQILYGLERAVRIKPRFAMGATVKKVAAETFAKNFETALARAMRTAR
jgi:hypothetical protein